MKLSRILAVALSLATVAWMFAQVQQNATAPSLDALFPQGPALYVEAKDLAASLRDWNASPEKAAWLKSDNYTVFSRTRLFMRLQEVQGEWQGVTGFSPDYPFAVSIAGTESALAIYDIGKLEFLYVSKLPDARVIASALGAQRSAYETRTVAGQNYYLKENRSNGKAVAYASAGGYLFLATREDLLAQALSLLATRQGASLKTEPWYADAAASAKAKGEFRLAMNMPLLLASPQFRSYWVQRNTAEFRQYRAGIADVFRDASGIREERVFLRESPSDDKRPSESAVARVLAIVPPDAGFHRAWAMPSRDEVRAVVSEKLIQPGADSAPAEYAPMAVTDPGQTGSEVDLEIAIDEPPLIRSGPSAEALTQLLAKHRVDAMLQAQTSRVLADGVFVRTPVTVVLLSSTAWDENALRVAVPGAFVTVRGEIAVLSDEQALHNAVVSRLSTKPANALGTYVAELRKGQELAPYIRMMTLIDAARSPGDAAPSEPTGPEGRDPKFFSENVASLARSLDRIDQIRFVARDEGSRVPQTVTYQFRSVR
ncbi:MAG TPA: hypothetical protein VE621_21100 [Bryobacteraceae bacterium]|nr:hypothetical protein [Bryobacteraceae bacterium]